MKKLIFVFLFLPVFVSAQYGFKKCHTDLVFGYDYGDRIGFDKNTFQDRSLSSLQTLRVGSNVNYPISDRLILVSGIRVASRFSYEDHKIGGINADGSLSDYFRLKTQDYYAEIPFRVRFILKNVNRENRLYLEGGTQFNFYVLSYWKEEYNKSIPSPPANEKIERTNDIRAFHLTSNLAFGWETELRNGPTFFVQTVGRVELIPADFYDKNVMFFGIETGLRF